MSSLHGFLAAHWRHARRFNAWERASLLAHGEFVGEQKRPRTLHLTRILEDLGTGTPSSNRSDIFIASKPNRMGAHSDHKPEIPNILEINE